MNNQNIQLNIGDEIGFVQLNNNADSADTVVFFPVAKVTMRDGERAYHYAYPDGEISRSAIRQSQLSSHVIRVNRAVTFETKPEMLLINKDRINEHAEALLRSSKSKLEVFNDFEFDTYVVVNHDNSKEYRVKLATEDGQVFSRCECPDFVYRHRVCKHISVTLHEIALGMLARN